MHSYIVFMHVIERFCQWVRLSSVGDEWMGMENYRRDLDRRNNRPSSSFVHQKSYVDGSVIEFVLGRRDAGGLSRGTWHNLDRCAFEETFHCLAVRTELYKCYHACYLSYFQRLNVSVPCSHLVPYMCIELSFFNHQQPNTRILLLPRENPFPQGSYYVKCVGLYAACWKKGKYKRNTDSNGKQDEKTLYTYTLTHTHTDLKQFVIRWDMGLWVVFTNKIVCSLDPTVRSAVYLLHVFN
jgi:hypothetical protein